MALPKLTKLELQMMELLWNKGPSSIREIQESFPERAEGATPPAYTTVQTVVYRLEWKKAIRRTGKVANAHVFEAVISRNSVQHRMIDDFWAFSAAAPFPSWRT